MRFAGLPYLPEGTPWTRRISKSIWADGEEAWPSAKPFPCASRLSGSAQPAKSTPTAVIIRCMGFKTVSVPQGEPPMSSSVAQGLSTQRNRRPARSTAGNWKNEARCKQVRVWGEAHRKPPTGHESTATFAQTLPFIGCFSSPPERKQAAPAPPVPQAGRRFYNIPSGAAAALRGAAPGNNGNGSCGVGQQTNGCGGSYFAGHAHPDATATGRSKPWLRATRLRCVLRASRRSRQWSVTPWTARRADGLASRICRFSYGAVLWARIRRRQIFASRLCIPSTLMVS